MYKSDFSPFSDPFMLSVDVSGVVPVGVRPPPPLRGSSPCEAGQFWHPHGEQKGRNDPPHGKQNGHYGRRMENRRGVTSRAEFIKSPLNFYCPRLTFWSWWPVLTLSLEKVSGVGIVVRHLGLFSMK